MVKKTWETPLSYKFPLRYQPFADMSERRVTIYAQEPTGKVSGPILRGVEEQVHKAVVGIDTCESVECSTSIKNPTFDRKE
jgi:hypothetical protein